MPKLWALIDANNYYVSCERLFNPSLRGVPVVVCGNLDRYGVIVSRSLEAKSLGVQMAQPAFQIENLLKHHNVRVCASNYTLYADIHKRMHEVVHRFTPKVYDYSIDEFFLDLTGFPGKDVVAYGHGMRDAVLKVGIPTSIGIGSTKLLAKLASEIAKSEQSEVCYLSNSVEVDARLKDLSPTKLWGVGHRYGKRLFRCGVRTALDLKNMQDELALKAFGIGMVRMIHELRGHSCISLDAVSSKKNKQYMCSRSFGRYVNSFDELQSHVVTFTTRAAERMRAQDQLCQRIDVFIMTNHFNANHDQYRNSTGLRLPAATAHGAHLIDAASKTLKSIYRKNYKYKKAGVILTEICDPQEYQSNLFFNEDMGLTRRLMKTVDAINFRYGQDTIHYGSSQVAESVWGTGRIVTSGHYTTDWDSLLKIG